MVSTAQTDSVFAITLGPYQYSEKFGVRLSIPLEGRREDQEQETLLFANENQNASCQRQNSHYDGRDGDVEQQSDSDKNQVNGEKEHSQVFGDVHAAFLRQSQGVCTL
jgi:hypothetical protein